jgi:hypothetical protein
MDSLLTDKRELRVTEALRRVTAWNANPALPTAAGGFTHRADAGGAAAGTDVVTKLAVILLSSINAVMWWMYTDSRVMGTVWAVIAIGFAIWIKRDVARR